MLLKNKKIYIIKKKDALHSDGINIIWDSYNENKNSISILRYIEENSIKIKLEAVKSLRAFNGRILQNKNMNKKLILKNKFNFWETSLLNQKSFYKDYSGNLNLFIKIIALKKILTKNKVDELRLGFYNKNLYNFLNKFLKKYKIKFVNDKKNVYFSKDKFFYNIKHQLRKLFFLKFLLPRIFLPKNKIYNLNLNILCCDYFSYFNLGEFKSGKYKSAVWGNLLNNISNKSKITFLHIYQNTELSSLSLKSSIQNFKNDIKKENHLILDTFLDWTIIMKIFIKWIRFNFYFSDINVHLNNINKKCEYNLSEIFSSDIKESLIGFESLMNLYYFFLFEKFFSICGKNIKKNIYIYENQGWEKSYLYFSNKKGFTKNYSIVSTPIRFWDLRYSEKVKLKNPNFNCVNGKISEKILLECGFKKKDIKLVDAVRYENLKDFKFIKTIKKKNEQILVLGDHLKSSNILIEKIISNIVKKKPNLKFIVKPHPILNFSKQFMSQKNIKVIDDLNLDFFNDISTVISPNMTSASLIPYYLGKKIIVCLDDNKVNFSPLKNLPGVNFISSDNDFFKIFNKKETIQLKKNFIFFFNKYKVWKNIFN